MYRITNLYWFCTHINLSGLSNWNFWHFNWFYLNFNGNFRCFFKNVFELLFGISCSYVSRANFIASFKSIITFWSCLDNGNPNLNNFVKTNKEIINSLFKLNFVNIVLFHLHQCLPLLKHYVKTRTKIQSITMQR